MRKPTTSSTPQQPQDPASDAKARALAAHGTLHPHPERVTDPLFCVSAFFDPRDVVQVKYEMLRKVRVEGTPITEAVRAFGLSRPTFYDAQAELAAGGLMGLLPLKKGPKRAHKMSDEVMVAVASILQAEPGLSPAAIAKRLAERHGVHVHGRSVARALARPSKKT
jgi:transposase